MALGIQNHTLSLFNQTHYYDFVQHRHDVFTKLNSKQDKFTFLENFNQTIAGIKFPTLLAPTEAYQAYAKSQKKRAPTKPNTFQKPEIIAALRLGISLPSSSLQTLNHHRVSQLRARAIAIGDIEGNLLSQGGSSFWPFENGRITRSPSLIRYAERIAEQNQSLRILNVISCIAALAILYTFLDAFTQFLLDRRN